MPVKGGPNIRTSQAIVWLDAADKSSYPGTGTTWINSVTPGTYNGTLNNTSFNSTDALGALFFSGSNTFADMGNIGAISASYTFQVAVKPLPTGSPYTILSYTSGSGTGSVTFRLDYSSSIQTAVFSAFASSGSVNKTYSLSTTIPTGSWSILQGSFNGTSLKFYRNGTLVNTTFTTGSITGYSDNNRFLVGGVSQFTGSYLSGSIGNVAVYSASLNTYFIATNYNGLATRFGLPTIITPQSDENVSDFINITGITDPTQIAAITNLVADLKAYNLWDKMVAIYPFVGGTATTHQYNLKQPSFHPVIWNGAITHDSNGVTFLNGGYGAITSLNLNTLEQNNTSFSVYNKTTLTWGPSTARWFMASTAGRNHFSLGFSTEFSGFQYAGLFQSGEFAFRNNTIGEPGYLVVSRTINTTYLIYRNSTIIYNTNVASTTPQNATIEIGRAGTNFIGTTTQNSAFATVGQGLSQSEVTSLTNLVQTYQTTLGRQA